MTPSFLDMIAEHVVLFDGAMGTMLYERGIFINRCFDEVNLSNPSMVERIHREYIEAGADVIETNTFGANRYKLKPHGLEERTSEINRQGAKIARRIAGSEKLVAGSIGPLGIKIEPWGPTSFDEAAEAFREQAVVLQEEGVDLFSLETFADLNEIHQAILGVRSVSALPIVAQMTLQPDGFGLYGTSPAEFAHRLSAWGAEVVGANCSVGPKVMLEVVEKMVGAVDNPISAQPNAGIPQNVEGRNIYLVSPEYLAEYARRFVQLGVRVVGGCCGTTPAHIRAIHDALRTIKPDRTLHPVAELPGDDEPHVSVVPREQKSQLAKRIFEGTFVKIVELVPPRGSDPSKALASARKLAEAGIDAINIPDSPRASSRMSPLALAILIERDAGIEAVLHYCCRDRNILGMQSDLLGAHALGLRNMLLITGDPIRIGDYPDATAVFDIDSIGLTNVVHQLNRGMDIGGRPLKQPTAFHIGVGVNPAAVNFEEEIRRFEWKVKAGAEYAITQPVFDLALFERFIERIKPIRIPIIAGIWPLTSFRNAEFMNNELPGVEVPDSIMKRMRDAQSGEKALVEGVSIASEILSEVAAHVAGVQISAPLNRHELALDVIRSGLRN
jgi:methionine synthase I (cobalamin-dependent)/5,10-methylenetetrahydrofolate reductase